MPAVPEPAPVEPVDPAQARELAAIVAPIAAFGGTASVHVVDVDTGAVVFDHLGNVPLNPASNMKLLTAATALRVLGPSSRMVTRVRGAVEPGGHVPVLVVSGEGDPTLRTEDLLVMARQVRDAGARTVDEVRIDGTAFGDGELPPAFEQQPSELSAFRAATAALSVNRNAYVLELLPADAAGGRGEPSPPCAVRVDAGASYFDIASTATTGGPRSKLTVGLRHETDPDGRQRLVVDGNVPAGSGVISFRRRVDDPLRYFGAVFAEALARVGVEGARRVTVRASGAPLPAGLRLLAARDSPTVARQLYAMGKLSDNFTAEMLLEAVGAHGGGPGTAARGIDAQRRTLEAAGADPSNATLVNGSGLFDGNLISADAIAHVLRLMYRDATLRAEYVAQLSVAGVDGTLGHRLERLPDGFAVRAKTGTLDDVIALSGYIVGPPGARTLAFSFLANGVRGQHWSTRALADTLVEALIAHEQAGLARSEQRAGAANATAGVAAR